MLIFGFKPRRFREWKNVLRAETRRLSFKHRLQLLVKILIVLGHSRKQTRKIWRYRARKCRHCPVWDPSLRRCGPEDFPDLGCRCYGPAIWLLKRPGQGWLTVTNGDPDKLCW